MRCPSGIKTLSLILELQVSRSALCHKVKAALYLVPAFLCQSPPHWLSEPYTHLTPCICKVRLLASPEKFSFSVKLLEWVFLEKLLFHPAGPEDFEHLSNKSGCPKVPDKCHCRFRINTEQMCFEFSMP